MNGDQPKFEDGYEYELMTKHLETTDLDNERNDSAWEYDQLRMQRMPWSFQAPFDAGEYHTLFIVPTISQHQS